MLQGNWIPIDKNAVHELPKNRPYTGLEAIFCLSVDIDNAIHKYTKAGKGSSGMPRTPDEAINLVMAHGQSISGYAALWGWSRCKVRTFINRIRQGLDTNQTGVRHPIRLIINNLKSRLDSNQTGVKQALDTTNYPISSNLNPKDKKRSTRTFSPPSIQDVTAYCKERNNHVDAQRWFDHYEAVGWFVGKKKMVEWKAAVRTWEISESGGKNSGKRNDRTGNARDVGSTKQAAGYSSAARNLGDGAEYPVDVEVTE